MDAVLYKKIISLALIKDKLRQLLSKTEVDRAVFFGVLAKIWTVITGLVTALLIIIKFTPELQGYYFTFGSLLALQVFVELGLGTVIIQFASHEWSKLRIDEQGGITGDQEALSRLASLASIVTRWFLGGGVIATLSLSLGGYIFFSSLHGTQVNWTLPWFMLCFFVGLNVCLIPIWSLLEGCNQVAAVYTYRFFQGVVTSIITWSAILLGAKLWAVSLSVAAIVVCASLFFTFRYRYFIKSLLAVKPSDSQMSWRKDILPMQWRIALSWISGYFAFSLFTPVIFHYHGSVVAGQFGMTWSVVGVVSMIAGSWLPPKVPRFGMLIAKKEYNELDNFFWRITKVFVNIAVLATVVVWYVIYFLNRLSHPIANRLLPLLPTTLFLVAQVITVLSLPFSTYLRAHKKEPLLFLSICAGVLTALATFILGKYSVTAIGFGYLAINIILVPLVFLIWYRCRQEWHV